MTLSHSASALHARLLAMRFVTFCWSASHVRRFEGADDEADAVALVAIVAGVAGAETPADEDAAAGSATIDASVTDGVSLGFVQ